MSRDATIETGKIRSSDQASKHHDLCNDDIMHSAYLANALSKEEREQLEEHYLSCDKCLSMIAGLIRALPEIETLSPAQKLSDIQNRLENGQRGRHLDKAQKGKFRLDLARIKLALAKQSQ